MDSFCCMLPSQVTEVLMIADVSVKVAGYCACRKEALSGFRVPGT